MKNLLCLVLLMSGVSFALEAQDYFDKNWNSCKESKAIYVVEGVDSATGGYIVRTKVEEEGVTEYYFPGGQISARYQMKKGKVKSSEFWNCGIVKKAS